MNNNFGVILAAGIGARFGASVPKQYMKLNGREIIFYSIDEFKKSCLKENFVVVLDKQQYDKGFIEEKYGVKCIEGGATRNESIYNAITYINNNHKNVSKVIFHDGARPFLSSDIIDKYFSYLENHRAAITAVKITDSIGYLNNDSVDREKYFLIQAPEAYHLEDLNRYFKKDSKATTPLHQLPKDIDVYKYFDFKYNLKITYPEDLFIAEQYIKVFYKNRNSEFLKLSKENRDKNFLILGGSGGVGSAIIKKLKANENRICAPTRKDIDLKNLSVENLEKFLGNFIPDVIINCAASNYSDDDGLLDKFDELFSVNLKSNLVLIEYAKKLNKRVNIVLFSSSASTKGRENIALYSASKAGVNSIVESLANKLSREQIYLNAIIPEKIDTPLIHKLHKEHINTDEMLLVDDVLDTVWTLSFFTDFGKLLHIRKGL